MSPCDEGACDAPSGDACILKTQGTSRPVEFDARAIDTITVRRKSGATDLVPIEEYVSRVLWCEFNTPWRDPDSYGGVQFPNQVGALESCQYETEVRSDPLLESLRAAAIIVRTYALTAHALKGYVVNTQVAGADEFSQVYRASHCSGADPVPDVFARAATETEGRVLSVYHMDELASFSITPFYRNSSSEPQTAENCHVPGAQEGQGNVFNPDGVASNQGYHLNPTNRGSADQEMLMCLGSIGLRTDEILRYFYGESIEVVSCRPSKETPLIVSVRSVDNTVEPTAFSSLCTGEFEAHRVDGAPSTSGAVNSGTLTLPGPGVYVVEVVRGADRYLGRCAVIDGGLFNVCDLDAVD